MKHESLNDMLLEELKDVYDAEQQITKALPKMAKAATSPELKAAFEEHLEMTKGQVERLKQAFEMIGKKASGKTCKGMQGLIQEGQEHIEEHEKSPLLDVALVGAAQRVEHYEIAAYGTICAMSDAMGQTQLSQLLHETLEEEKQTDERLTRIGTQINQECAQQMEMSR
jgi:ferritin-like metal-binding protein YciE